MSAITSKTLPELPVEKESPCCFPQRTVLISMGILTLLGAALATWLTHAYLGNWSYGIGGGGAILGGALVIIGIRCQPPVAEVRGETQLNWEDMLSLMHTESALGLRHVDSLEKAQEEKVKGFFGDASNLDPSVRGTWKTFSPESKPDSNGFTEAQRWILWPDAVSDENRQKLIHFWQEGVQDFIGSGWTTPRSAFLLVDYKQGRKGSAYDFHYGKGLGKKGKGEVNPENIIAILPPPVKDLSREELIAHHLTSLTEAIRAYAREEGR